MERDYQNVLIHGLGLTSNNCGALKSAENSQTRAESAASLPRPQIRSHHPVGEIVTKIIAAVILGGAAALSALVFFVTEETVSTTVLGRGAADELVTAPKPATPRYDHRTISSPSEFQEWQSVLRSYLKNNVFKIRLHDDRPVSVHDAGVTADGLHRQELVIFAADGARIPAVILTPDEPNGATVVFLPGHVREGESGLLQASTPVDSYHNAAAVRLANAGYVTASIELRGFGVLGEPTFPDHKIVAYNALLNGTFYKQKVLADVASLVQYLVEKMNINVSRLGIAGVSLGAELAVAYAAMDERINAVASHSYGGGHRCFLAIERVNRSTSLLSYRSELTPPLLARSTVPAVSATPRPSSAGH